MRLLVHFDNFGYSAKEMGFQANLFPQGYLGRIENPLWVSFHFWRMGSVNRTSSLELGLFQKKLV